MPPVDLHIARCRRGVAAAPHWAAVEAGRAVLAEGGNALEAMVAMAAMIAVVYPHMTHLGGDGFWTFRESGGRVRAIMAGGRAGANARIERYREEGFDAIPPRGPLAALTAPGAVSGWATALDAAKTQGGRLPLAVLLEPAVHAARAGVAVTRSHAELAAAHAEALARAPGYADVFLIDGKPPEAGARLRQPQLAATLDHLANAGLDDFYRGDVGREIAGDLARIGSPLTRADLEAQRARVVAPLRAELSVGAVYNTPPPTQGLASLVILTLFDRLGVAEAEGFDHIHGLVEATKRAFRLRDRAIADPDRLPAPPETFLASAFLDGEAGKIDRRKAAPWPLPAQRGDTVWMGAADAGGLVVSYIQSIYWEFGSGCVLPRTGVLMSNRGLAFSLDPGALNALAPGRLPFHTLNPALAVLKDGRALAYGAMGGDGQPQTQSALFTRYALFRQPLAEAIDRPRWLLGRTWGEARDNLRLEARFPERLVDRLTAAGHDVAVLAEPYSGVMGHAGAVVLHRDGTAEGAHDPRADGGAAGV